MATKSFDVLVAKEFQVEREGKMENRTSWNCVGRGWPGKSPQAIGFELFLFPGQKYVLHLGGGKTQFRSPFDNFESIGGENV